MRSRPRKEAARVTSQGRFRRNPCAGAALLILATPPRHHSSAPLVAALPQGRWRRGAAQLAPFLPLPISLSHGGQCAAYGGSRRGRFRPPGHGSAISAAESAWCSDWSSSPPSLVAPPPPPLHPLPWRCMAAYGRIRTLLAGSIACKPSPANNAPRPFLGGARQWCHPGSLKQLRGHAPLDQRSTGRTRFPGCRIWLLDGANPLPTLLW